MAGLTMNQEAISLQTIWEGMQQMKLKMISHMSVKLETTNISLNTIEGSLSILGEHVAELEQRVGSNEDTLQDLIKRVKTLERDNC